MSWHQRAYCHGLVSGFGVVRLHFRFSTTFRLYIRQYRTQTVNVTSHYCRIGYARCALDAILIFRAHPEVRIRNDVGSFVLWALWIVAIVTEAPKLLSHLEMQFWIWKTWDYTILFQQCGLDSLAERRFAWQSWHFWSFWRGFCWSS